MNQAEVANRFFAIVVLAVLAIPRLAAADNTAAANAEFLFLGEVAEDSIGSSGDCWWKLNLEGNRSYSFSVWAPSQDPSESDVSLSIAIFDDDGVTPALGTTTTDKEPLIVTPGHTGDQVAIIPNSTGTYRLRVTNAIANVYSIHVLGIETTLFSPWYFVDISAGYDGFVEFRNNTSSPLSLTVTAFNSSGSTAGTMTFSLAGNGNRYVQIGAAFGLSSDFGSVQLAHNGTPGAVVANITTLSATTGLSFDAPFAPRMSWSTFTKGGKEAGMPHVHDDYLTHEELETSGGGGAVHWENVTNRPAGLDDGDDDTTYTAGSGLVLNGTQFRLSSAEDLFTPTANTLTTLDSAGSVGGTSVTIGSDGLGLISYRNGNLKVAHCNDVACTTATLTALDTTGNVWGYTSVTIGSDGLGLISYYDGTDLKVAHCNDVACASATLTALDTTGGGEYTSVTIGSDGPSGPPPSPPTSKMSSSKTSLIPSGFLPYPKCFGFISFTIESFSESSVEPLMTQ